MILVEKVKYHQQLLMFHYFKDAIYKQLFYMNKKLVKVFETQQHLGAGKQFAPASIPNLESEYPSKVKKLEK